MSPDDMTHIAQQLAAMRAQLQEQANTLDRIVRRLQSTSLHCDKCGAVIPGKVVGKVVTDTGSGAEAGRSFFYCSTDCRDSH